MTAPAPFASVVMPAVTEVRSLIEAVDTIFAVAGEHLRRVFIVVCEKTTKDCLAAGDQLSERYPSRVVVVPQRLPLLGGALREGLAAAEGSHVVVMYSDGESDPSTIAPLLAEARRSPEAIVSASRWLRGSVFEGYPPGKTLLNWLFQKLFAALYGTSVTDFTFGYRVYPLALVRAIAWEEVGHAFVFESIVKPLRLGVAVRELPTVWKTRAEGQSQLRPWMYLRYFLVGVRTRLGRADRFLNAGAGNLRGI